MDMTIRLHAILSMLLLAALTACDRDDRSVSAPAEGELRISTKSSRESTGAADGYEDQSSAACSLRTACSRLTVKRTVRKKGCA